MRRHMVMVVAWIGSWWFWWLCYGDGQGVAPPDGCASLGCCGVAPCGLHADVVVPSAAMVE